MCTELSKDGNAVKCSFRQVLPDYNKKVGSLSYMEAAMLMVENRTTITIPDGNICWGNGPEDAPGEYKVRIEGLKVNRRKKKA